MQPAPQKKRRSWYDYLLWGMIGFGGLLLACLIAWLVLELSGKTNSDTGKTQRGAAAVLEPETTAPYTRTISSTLGVQIPYNARELEGFGFADEVTFADTDLAESRAYTIMRVRPIETSEATRSEVTLASPELRVTSSPNKGYWEMLATKKEYKDLSKIDMLVKETVTAHTADKTIEASDTEVKNINDTDYRKVTFTSTNERYGVTTIAREDCYMTVQHDRPYVACIGGIRASNFAVVPQLETVLSSISYDGLDTKALVTTTDAVADASMLNTKDDAHATSGSTGATEENKSTSKTASSQYTVPSYLADTASFKSIAGSVPATVRVGTLYCADIKLSLPEGGDGPTLTGACVDKAGTGFFVSSDGYLATSASTVQVKPEEAISAYITNAPDSEQALSRLQRILDYLVDARSLMQTDADALLAGVQERDQDIIAKINALSSLIKPEDVAITKERYAYALQLADKPIVVNQNGDGSSSFAYTDTVIEANLEAKDYSTSLSQMQIYEGETVKSDTALLKVKKNAIYPTLVIGNDTVADKQAIGLAGFPMYAYGSLASAQFRATPLYRLGAVTQTFSGGEGQKVRAISTSSHAGLAGAPALSQTGEVAGMATYGNLNCPDRKCFASTVIRDASGVGALVKKRNITLQTDSASMQVWQDGLTQLTRGNYREAAQLFTQAGQLYPQNYQAARFADYSRSQYGSATDTSTMNSIVVGLQLISTMAGGILILLGIAYAGLKFIIRPHTETQYGQMGGQYIDSRQWQHQSAAPVQTLAPQAMVPQPASWQPAQQQYPVQQPSSVPPASPSQSAPFAPGATPTTSVPPGGTAPQPPQPSSPPVQTWPPQPPAQS